jgi:hypothetical protein
VARLTDKASSGSPPGATTQPARGDAKTIDELTAQARQQIKVGKFDDALTTIDRIVELDPRNEYAAGVRPLVKDKLLLAEQRRIRDDYDRQLASPPINHTEAEPVDARLGRRRWTTLPELKLDAVAFTDADRQLRGQDQTEHLRELASAGSRGHRPPRPVTAHLRDSQVRQGARARPRRGRRRHVKLGYTIDDGVVTITTQEDLAKNTRQGCYDIRDLTRRVPDYAPEPKPQAAPSTQPKPSQLEQITQLIRKPSSPMRGAMPAGRSARCASCPGS